MNDFEYIKALTDIDDGFVQEASTAAKITHISRKRKIVLLVAAATMALMLVACGVYNILAASSEVYTSRYTSVTVNDRIDAMDPLQYDSDHVSTVALEYGIAKEDIVVKHYNEYLSHGYYFDEVFIVTKETAVARIVTDAKNFTFDVEFIGFFHNEKKDEFKAVSQKTTAQGGTIEIIMNAEDGWECFGGFLGRSHPEAEINTFSGFSAMDNIDSRAILFMNDYYDKLIEDSNKVYLKEKSEVAITWDYYYDHIYDGTFDRTESDEPLALIEQVASKYGMESVSKGKFFYDKRTLTGEQFIEVGFAYDKDGLIAFANNTIENSVIRMDVTGVFYNAERDEYRTINGSIGDVTGILKMESKKGWECIGVTMYRNMPEADGYEHTGAEDFTPVEGDETDSQKFFEKVKKETDNNILKAASAAELSEYKQSRPGQTVSSSTNELTESTDIMFSKTKTASEVTVRVDGEDEDMFYWILDYYDKKERLAQITKEYLDEKFSIAPPVYDPDFDYEKHYDEQSWSLLSYDYEKEAEEAPYYYENGFVHMDNKAVVFNITNNNDVEFKTLVTGIFYNAETDECITEEQYVEIYGGSVITMTAQDGWEFKSIIVTTYAQGDDKPVTKTSGISGKELLQIYNEIVEKHKSDDFRKEFLAR